MKLNVILLVKLWEPADNGLMDQLVKPHIFKYCWISFNIFLFFRVGGVFKWRKKVQKRKEMEWR